MADNLLGLSPEDMQSIQALMSQMGPQQADRDAAQSNRWLTFGLGLLGARKYDQFQRLGEAGLLGQQAYQNTLQNAAMMRGENLKQATEAINLSQMLAMRKAMLAAATGDDSAPVSGAVQPDAGVSPKTAAQFGGAQAGFSNLPPAPLSVPPGTNPAQINGYTPPDWRSQMPAAARRLVGLTDPKTFLENVKTYSETKNGPNGLVTTFNGTPKYQYTDTGVQFFNPDGSPGQFVNMPGKTASDVAKAGATSRAQAEGTGAVKLVPYQTAAGIANIPETTAAQIQSSGLPAALKDKLATAVPADQVPAAIMAFQKMQMGQPGGGSLQPDGTTTPTGIPSGAAPPIAQPNAPVPMITQGVSGGAGAPAGLYPGGGMQPNPLTVKAAETNIETGGKQQQGVNASNTAMAQKQLEDAQAKRPIAINMLAGLDNLERADKQGVFNGPAQNQYMKAAIWINSIFPGANLDVNKISNSQEYDSALKGLARSGLKSFGGRVTNSEFQSVLASMPDRVATAQGRADMRQMMGAAALDELNQINSAEQHWQQHGGSLMGWNPPSPITPSNYWGSRVQVQGLQPKQGLNATQQYDVQNILKSGNQDAIKQLIVNGVLTR